MKRRSAIQAVLTGMLLILLVTAMPSAIRASETPLPLEAQEAMERGLAAARQQEWPLAIKYFTEARKAAPKAPQVIFNLALACDKAGGRELLALALYRTYLAADPGANNAAQVRSQIVQLEVKAEADIIKLVQKVKEMFAALPRGTSTIYDTMALAERDLGRFEEADRSASLIPESERRDSVYTEIFAAREKAYDLEGALKTLSRLSDTKRYFYRYESVLRAMLKTEQFSKAKELVKMMKEIAEGMRDEKEKADAYKSLFYGLLEAGDLAGAAGVVAKVPVGDRPDAYGAISRGLLKTGDLTGAIEAAAKSPETSRISVIREIIAKARSKGGDLTGVVAIVDLCIKAVQGIGNESDRLHALGTIANTQIDMGMKDKALETLKKAMDRPPKGQDRLSWVSGLQAWAGDVESARKTAEALPDPRKLSAYLSIAEAQAFAGDKAGARETIARVKPLFPQKHDYVDYYYIHQAMAGADDDGFKEVLAKTDYSIWPFELWKAKSYLDVFYERTKAHDKVAARKAIDQALRLASECPDKYEASRITLMVSRKLIEAGEKAEAEELIRRVTAICAQMSDPAKRDGLYGWVASLKVMINDLPGAMEAASRITNDRVKVRDPAYVAIFGAMIKARDVSGAKESAKRISSLYEKRLACDGMANLLAVLGHFNESIAMERLYRLLSDSKDYSDTDEFGFWSGLVDKYFEKPPIAYLKGYIDGLKFGPDWQVAELAKAVQEMAWAFKELRDEAGKWEAYRSLR